MNHSTVNASTYCRGFPWPKGNLFTTATAPAQTLYNAAREDYFARFTRLLDQWRSQTIFSSFVEEKIKHPAFRQIVELREYAIPLILREIYVKPDFLYLALQMITGENPVPKRDRGNARAAIDAWIEWGRRSGFEIT